MVLGFREHGWAALPLRRFILGPGDSSKDHEFSLRGGDVQLWRVHPSGSSAWLAAWSHTHTQPPSPASRDPLLLVCLQLPGGLAG